jgi:hypothetical protein
MRCQQIMNDKQIQAREDMCMFAAILFYAITVGLGIGGAVLAAYGHTLPGTLMGAGAFTSAVLSMLTARASIRWRRLLHDPYR